MKKILVVLLVSVLSPVFASSLSSEDPTFLKSYDQPNRHILFFSPGPVGSFYASELVKPPEDNETSGEEPSIRPVYIYEKSTSEIIADNFFYVFLPLAYAGTSIYYDQKKYKDDIESNPMRWPNAGIMTVISFGIAGMFTGYYWIDSTASQGDGLMRVVGALAGVVVGITAGAVVYGIYHEELNRSKFVYYAGTAYVASVPLFYYYF